MTVKINLSTNKVLLEIATERNHQDNRWGGPDHDDKHSINDFVQWIQDYAGWARMQAANGELATARKKLVQVAALATSAVEAIDRNTTRH